eukprot:TRINITY_DN100573_c0_g1_i1.p1 TRINITY_DN100573_c0_g1~~TRINITY_DN100573_c0_g1_i1.p1  ORF type:complete len:563 (-),score=196.46 TRINITY_DN100573_c0_g1_i1:219-1907(-)
MGVENEAEDEQSTEADEFALAERINLITFENLENVVRHVVKKFKNLECYNEEISATLKSMGGDISRRVLDHTMDEFTQEVRGKTDALGKGLKDNRDACASIENQLESTRLRSSAIERRLETIVQEMSVQDRQLRETQDLLSDKVGEAELNMFEAKLAGYATHQEQQELKRSLGHYTKSDVTERLSESVRIMGTRFEDYTRTSSMEQQLQDIRDHLRLELDQYALAKQTNMRFEEITDMIREQSQLFERTSAMLDDKVRALSDRMTSIFTDITKEVDVRAMDADVQELRLQLSSLTNKEDSEVSFRDCMPKVNFCVEQIRRFDEKLGAQDKAIARVDEVLLDKAGKQEVSLVYKQVDTKYEEDKAIAEFQKMYERIDWMNNKMQHYMEQEADRMSKFRPPNYEPVFEKIHQSLLLKADKADMVELYSVKADRIDGDELSRLQDIVQRQLEYLAVTTLGLAKLALSEPKGSEQKIARMQQKAQVLMQAENLWHWLLHSEAPPNLDTLRSPAMELLSNAGRKLAGRLDGSEASLKPDISPGHSQKRVMDDRRRQLLEKRLGLDID